ncbi:MAG: hypothetical protein Q8R53_03795 [Nanoarchaeota archaeon]|nr:hypothetical protein [Nanoarchaeota archaeon]
MSQDTGKMVRVDFKLEIPFGEGSRRSLDYYLDVESFGGNDAAERQGMTYNQNLDRLKRDRFDCNLLPYEKWDIVFRGFYQKGSELKELALELEQTGGWYGVDLITRKNYERERWENVFRMPDGTVCPFKAVIAEENEVSFGELAERNPDLFRFIYGRNIEEIREVTAKHMGVRGWENALAYGGPFSELFGGTRTRFPSNFQNNWVQGISSNSQRGDLFCMGDAGRAISRGVRYVQE